MDTAFLISAFVTLFVVIDPPGLAPIFVALTRGTPQAERRAIARRACLIATGLLMVFAFAGEAILGFMGISMAAFRIAGGLLLFFTAFDMIFERRTKRREDQGEAEIEAPDPSVFPLAMPLIAGPGSIASMILLMGQTNSATESVLVLGVMLSVMAILLFSLSISGFIERALGRTGIMVVTRLLGMLLAALSVQFVLTGLKEFGFGGAI